MKKKEKKRLKRDILQLKEVSYKRIDKETQVVDIISEDNLKKLFGRVFYTEENLRKLKKGQRLEMKYAFFEINKNGEEDVVDD